jgi:hypothetical protein
VAVPAGGPAVQFLAAAGQTGMGSFDVTPQVSIYPDPSAWAGSPYSAQIIYTISAGPGWSTAT